MNRAVFDTGPLIHLWEIKACEALRLFKKVLISREVVAELRLISSEAQREIMRYKQLEHKSLADSSKDFMMLLVKRGLDVGEASSIALARQENIRYLFTDDLNARTEAQHLGFEVHGTVGLLLRAFREKIFNKKVAVGKLQALHDSSTLFITKPLVEKAINEIEHFKR